MDYYQITIKGYSLKEMVEQLDQALVGVLAPNTFASLVSADSVESDTSVSAPAWVFNILSANVSGPLLTGNALVCSKTGTTSSVLLTMLDASGDSMLYLGKSNTPGNGGVIEYQPSLSRMAINTIGQSDQLTLSASTSIVNTNSAVTVSGYATVPRQIKIPSVAVTGATAIDLGAWTYQGIRQVNFSFRNLVSSEISYVQIGGAGGWYGLTPTHDDAYTGNTNYDATLYLKWTGQGIPLWFGTSQGPYNLSGSLEFTWIGGASEQWSVRGMIANTTISSNLFNYALVQGVVKCFLPDTPMVLNMRVITATAYTGGAIYGMTF